MARIIPSDDGPGAREAGTIEWLDRYLSGIDSIYAKPDGSGFIQLEGEQAEAWRARVGELRERYREGVGELNRLAAARFGSAFAELGPEQQDEVLTELERGVSFDRERTQAVVLEEDLPFFALLVMHTRQAFYSDPVYGGNRGHVGWKHVGFHGPESMADALSGRYTTDEYLA